MKSAKVGAMIAMLAVGVGAPALAEVGVIAIAEGETVSWGAAVAPEREDAAAAARDLCETRFEDEQNDCGRLRTIREERCFSIAVDLPLRRAIGYADHKNVRMSKLKAVHACQRAGGVSCALQHVECVPKTVEEPEPEIEEAAAEPAQAQ